MRYNVVYKVIARNTDLKIVTEQVEADGFDANDAFVVFWIHPARMGRSNVAVFAGEHFIKATLV